MNQTELYSKTSMNTIDRYSIYNTYTNNCQHNNLFYYILLECDFQKSWINSCFDTEGILEHDYQWKFSLWNTLTLRLSCESFINVSSKANLDIDFIYAIEFIPTIETTLDNGKYYVYLDLVHRATGIPVASGSCDITELCFIKHSKKNSLQRHMLGMKNIAIDLVTNQNIKNWNTIRQYPTHSSSNNNNNNNGSNNINTKNVRNSLQFCCTVGSLLTTERMVNNQITMSSYKSSLDFLHFNDRIHNLRPKMIKVISSSKPTMFSYLQISNQLRQLEKDQEAYNSNIFSSTNNNNTLTSIGIMVEDDILQSFIEPQLTGHEHAWLCHVSISDVQLTSDILDLYMDRNIVITGGCGNVSALTSQTYLGHISKYVGSFVEKAEIIHPIVHNYESIENKIYRSCIHIEVKIVEEHRIANNSIDFDAPFEHKATSFNTFNLCHGIIIESLNDDQLHIITNSSNNNYDEDAMHALERTAVPLNALTSGNYEVLLYSLPNNELDLEQRIVGKAYVRIDIDGNHVFLKTKNDLIMKSISLKEEFHRNIYEKIPIKGLNQLDITTSLSSFLLLLQFLMYNMDGINKLSTLNKQLSLKQTQDPLHLQNLMNDTIIIHNQQKAKLFDKITTIFSKLNHVIDMDSVFMSECLSYLCENVMTIIPISTPKYVSDSSLQRYSVMHALQSYFQHWLTCDVLKELIEKSSSQMRPSFKQYQSLKQAKRIYSSLTIENSQYRTYWDSITSLSFCIKLMIILYDQDYSNDNNNSNDDSSNNNQSSSKNYLENIIRREFLNDQITLIEISEDLIIHVFNYLNNITLNATDLLHHDDDGDVSKSQQIQIDTIHIIHEGLHAIYTLISTLPLLQPKGQETVSTFIESFVQFALYVGNHDHHELDFCTNEVVNILMKLCTITVKYIHPSGIRKFGTLKYISIETHKFTKSLDSLTIAIQYLTRKIFLLNNTTVDNSLLILTITKCITTMCGKFSNMLKTFKKTIKSSEEKLTEHFNQSISLDNNVNNKYADSPRIAGKAVNRFERKHATTTKPNANTDMDVIGDIIPSPYSGGIVLQVFYENRFYLNCIQQLLQSLNSLQVPLPLITTTTSNTTNMSINSTNESNTYATTNATKGGDSVGLIASSLAIHDMIETTLNSICKGTLSIANFSSYVFTHADKLFLSCTNHNNSVNIMYFQSYICRLQGMSLAALEKSVCLSSILKLNADHYLNSYKASIEQIESILLGQNNYTILLQHLLHSDPLLNADSFEKFSIGSYNKEASKRTTVHTYLSDVRLSSTNFHNDLSQEKLYYINTIEMWYYFYHSILNTIQGICMYIIHLCVRYDNNVNKTSLDIDNQDNKLYQLFEEAVNLMCKTTLMTDIVLDRKDVTAISLNKSYLYESMLPIVSNIFMLIIKTPYLIFNNNLEYCSSYQDQIVCTLVRLIKGHIDAINAAAVVLDQSIIKEEELSKLTTTTHDSLLNYIVMILEELFKLSISDQMQQSILLNPLQKYLLSTKISSNIGIEYQQTNNQQKKSCTNFFRSLLDALITDENNLFNGSYQAISYFNTEYALHLTAILHHLSINWLFTDHKKEKDIIAKKLPKVLINKENSIQTECYELVMSSTLSQNIIYIYQYLLLNNEKDVNIHLTLMIEDLSKIFNKYQKFDKYTTILNSISNVHSKAAVYENFESSIIKYLGCSNKAYLNMLKLLLHHQDAQLKHRYHVNHFNDVTLSQEYLEIELDYLRICLQTLLSSGFWEVGINLSNVYLNKYKTMNNNNILQNTSLPSSPYNSSPTRSVMLHSPSNNCSTYSGLHSPGNYLSRHYQSSGVGITTTNTTIGATPVTRQESVKAELLRMIDQFQSKINHDGILRIFGQFYAIRFFTNTPWYCDLSELDQHTIDILNNIPNYNCKYMTAQMINTPNEKHPHHYEYWLILHFDSASYRNCAEYYEQIVLDEDQKSKEFQYKEQYSKDSNFYNLSSPITYHSIANIITQAFPEYLLLSSHHLIDDYFKDNNSYNNNNESNMKFMQVFQAFPSILCDKVHDDNFIDIIDPIIEEEDVRVVASDDVNYQDVNKDTDISSDEKKESHSIIQKTVDISLDELLSSYQPMLLNTQYTRFYAYAIMNEDECISRNQQQQQQSLHSKEYVSSTGTTNNNDNNTNSSTSIPMVSGDAYINRFELITTQGTIDYSQLGIPIVSNQSEIITTTSISKNSHTNSNSMNVFSINPINIAINQCNVVRTITDSSLEIMFYYTILLYKSLQALYKLNEFTKNDLLNEPTQDITNSNSVFMGIFTLLCNILETPNATCINLSYMESIIISEQDRLEVEWQIFRKNLKRNYMRELLEYDTKKAAIDDNQNMISKLKRDRLLYNIIKPMEPNYDQLKEEYDSSEKHNHVYVLHKLYTNIEILILNIIDEMKKLTNSKNYESTNYNEEEFSTKSKNYTKPFIEQQQQQQTNENQYTIQLKLCLYLETLYYAREISIVI